MSRTDAHTPYRVRVAHREIAVRAGLRSATRQWNAGGVQAGWEV